MAQSKDRCRQLLDDVCADYCQSDHYCILKEFFVHSGASPRLLTQMKCVEKFKYERSQRAGHELSWSEAMKQWVEEGLAKRFSDLYRDDIRFLDLYRAIMLPIPAPPRET